MHLYGLDVSSPGAGVARRSSGFRDVPNGLLHPLQLRTQVGPAPGETAVVWGEWATTLHVSGEMTITVTAAGEGLQAVVSAPRRPSDRALVHPIMGFVAAASAWWTGRLAFHAAAVVIEDRAWVLLGSPGAGKSTLAAWADRQGVPVLADDVVVLDDGGVFAGPRTADLRTRIAGLDDAGDEVVLGPRRRWRVALGAVPTWVALGGFVSLEWGERVQWRSSTSEEQLAAFGQHEALARGPATPTGYLDLLRWPAFSLTRPRDAARREDVLAALRAIAAR